MPRTEKQALTRTRPAAPPGNKHAERTALTRSRLIEAAETIFARDGFEAAKLEDIAAEAGYTRGALYANFSNKEDLFIALLSDQLEKRIARAKLGAQIAGQSPNVVQTMRENYLRSVKDPIWNVLFLEYKLFILRHPEFKPKITEMQTRAYASITAAVNQIYNEAGIRLPVSSLAAAMALAALGNTLGLDLQIGRAITEPEAETILRLFYDALTADRTRPKRGAPQSESS